MKNPLTVKELLLCENDYCIPLYQRNFAWTDIEISQLVIDVLDAIKENKTNYYIGTLVICKNKDKYDVIDGQQRFTALLLISLVLQNHFKTTIEIDKINLSFTARKYSNETLKSLFANESINIDNEITTGYKNSISAISEYVGKNEYSGITASQFYNYLLNNVKVFINEMPQGTDVNLYFERFNSRGEQLEFHEIIKAELMQKLLKDQSTTTIQKFAKIWDACSDFDIPCIKFFKKKTKCADNDNEREKIFNNESVAYEQGKYSWQYNYSIKDNLYTLINVNNENKYGLLDDVEIDEQENDGFIDETNKYRCIVNFNTFLYYVLYITDGKNANEIQLDDKKLKDAFKVSTRDSEWILRFGKNLLQCKFIFDNYIIRNATETTNRLKEGQWFLRKAYREDKNEKQRGHLYVQTRFDKNSFTDKNDEIIMLQSMFAVTFTAYKDTKWLYTIMQYLFDNARNLNQHESGNRLYLFLENLARTRFAEMLGSKVDNDKLRYDENVPIYAFNLMDYVLWKNRNCIRKGNENIMFDEFNFTYRRSIEHWYPQNPDTKTGWSKMKDDLLHSFGNLCLIVASQNSSFGNLIPPAKLDQWSNRFAEQSLKLQIMANVTKSVGSWQDKETIEKHENEMVRLLNEFIAKNSRFENIE